MRYLLDTHTLLWSFNEPERIKPIIGILTDPSNEVFFSAVNIWEIAIKNSIGKMDITPTNAMLHAKEQSFTEAPITAPQAAAILTLRQKGESSHKDPFDNLLVAQAKEMGAFLLTADHKVCDTYNEPCIMKY